MKQTELVNKRHYLWLLIVVLLAIDQFIKIEIKTTMSLYESVRVTNWFYLCFVENNGMAFGMSFLNKVVLTLFRLVASGFIGYYLYVQIRKQRRWIFLVSVALVLAGAVGNIIDCLFYGVFFTESTSGQVASIVGIGDGYAPFMQGRVVDMFYFPLIESNFPSWMPFVGGQHFVFFHPVFNFADACVSVGFILLIMFCRAELKTLSLSSIKTE